MVRMQDVAEHANVSIATVSFVVNGSKRVSDATRLRVERAMAELGFTRNLVARALASKRSRLVALVFPEVDTRFNAASMAFVHGASTGSAERDHHLVIWPVASDPLAFREYLDGGLVDGVLAMEVQLDDPRVPVLEAAGVPFVLIGRTADPSAYAYADIDFETTTARDLDRLAALGHRRIALVMEPNTNADRDTGYGPLVRVERAYCAWMAEHGLAPVMVPVSRDPAGGEEAAGRLVTEFPEVTAVACFNDEAAPGLLRALRRHGRSVPGDMSVLGLGMSSKVADLCEPPLAHSDPPGFALGRAAAHALIDLLDDPDADRLHTLLACEPHDGPSLGMAGPGTSVPTAPSSWEASR